MPTYASQARQAARDAKQKDKEEEQAAAADVALQDIPRSLSCTYADVC